VRDVRAGRGRRPEAGCRLTSIRRCD
jgi:hypothetical protein